MPYTQNTHLAFAKLSATPTDTAWSQVYNAGNLFACISLTRREPGDDTTSLHALGKNILNHFESEFFTLEEKNGETIREALQKSTETVSQTISINFCLAYFQENILSLFLIGDGRIILKRGDKLGMLLEQKESNNKLHTASGYVQNGDIILLSTHQFTKHLSDKQIREALELSLPNDIAEELSIHMHAKSDGGQAAIVISYQGKSHHSIESTQEITNTNMQDDERSDESNDELSEPETIPHKKQLIAIPPLPRGLTVLIQRMHLSHGKKLLLSVIVIVLILLVISITFTKQRQTDQRLQEQFTEIYTPALKHYDEGKALAELNKTISDEDFHKAEALLLAGKNTFPANSEEANKIAQLLAKVQQALSDDVQQTSTAKKITAEANSLLAVEEKNNNGLAFTQNETTVYFATDKAIISIAMKDGAKKILIENTGDWKNAVGIAVYNGNIYLLDQGNTVLKYTAGSDGFGNSNYFTDKPDLSQAVSMSIDSAVYLLFSDGTIKKYLRGKEETFVIKNLKQPFTNPTKIITTADMESIYILDPQNSRIVKLAKDGTFQNAYADTIIKQAKDVTVSEDEQKLFILAQDAVWEITADK